MLTQVASIFGLFLCLLVPLTCANNSFLHAGVQLPQQQIPANLVSYDPPVTSSSTPSTSTSNSSLATAPAGSAGNTAVANLTSSGVATTATSG